MKTPPKAEWPNFVAPQDRSGLECLRLSFDSYSIVDNSAATLPNYVQPSRELAGVWHLPYRAGAEQAAYQRAIDGWQLSPDWMFSSLKLTRLPAFEGSDGATMTLKHVLGETATETLRNSRRFYVPRVAFETCQAMVSYDDLYSLKWYPDTISALGSVVTALAQLERMIDSHYYQVPKLSTG